MMEKIRGRTWVFGDNFDVDFEIVPFRKLRQLPREQRTEEGYGQYAFTLVDPDFPKKVQKGDIVVAGKNFGCGHDHVTAPQAIKGCGIAAVIAESYPRNFYRNAIHIGLPIIEYPGIRGKVNEGDELEIDYKAGIITNLNTGETLTFQPLPDFLLEIIEAGGLYPILKKQIVEGKDLTLIE
jgi:3-isopropylmalate/(R)-2-methylmalate dehydratase small subunit